MASTPNSAATTVTSAIRERLRRLNAANRCTEQVSQRVPTMSALPGERGQIDS